jgi:hypothetical protein
MDNIRIQFVDKLAPDHRHITHLGSDTYRFTRAEVVRRISGGLNGFYVFDGTNVAYLEVVNDPYTGPYVRTRPDQTVRDNLLSLPPCPYWLTLVA